MTGSAPAVSTPSRPLRGAIRAAKHAMLVKTLSVTLGAFVLVAAILSINAGGFAATNYIFVGTASIGAPWNTPSAWIISTGATSTAPNPSAVDYPGTQTGDTALLNNGRTADVNVILPNPLAGLTVDIGSVVNLNVTAGDAITVGSGTFAFNSGQLNGIGSLGIAAPALLNFSTSSNTFLGATINNSGRIDYAPLFGASLSLTSSAAIHNSGAFNLLNDAPISAATPIAPGLIHNGPGATLTKSVGLSTAVQTIAPGFSNDGVVAVQVGTLALAAGGGFSHSGQFTIAPAAAFELISGTHSLTTLTASPSAAGPPSITGGSVQIDSLAALSINITGDSGAALYDVSKTFLNAGSFAPNNLITSAKTDFLAFNNGSIRGAGDFLLRSSGKWIGGQISSSGILAATNKFIVAPAATFVINPSLAIDSTSNITFLNQGRVNYVPGLSPFLVNNGTTIQNAAGAIWDLQGDTTPAGLVAGFGTFKTVADVYPVSRKQPSGILLPPPEFFNNGLLEKTNTNLTLPGSTFLNFHVTNAGTIDAFSGTINFVKGMLQTAGTTVLANGAPTVAAISSPLAQLPPVSIILNGGTLTGGGTVGGDLTNNSGTILPGTPTTIDTITLADGKYIQGPTGSLTLKLASTASFDQLNTTIGSDAFSGALNLQSFGGYTAPNGATFDILHYASETGAFTTINPIGLNAAFSMIYGPTTGTAVAVVPTISINNVTANEGNAGTTAFTFNVTLSGASTQTVTVNYATADGTATAASGDYIAQSGTLTFAPGTTSQSITVLVNGDTTNEPNETFTVNLTGPAFATIAAGTGTGTILNDDAIPTISINSVSQAEGNAGTTPFVFTVTLSNASSQAITVNFATANGTATAGSDYTATSGALTFAPGVTTQTITVPVIGDTLNELDETFTVNLSAPANATLATATGTGNILNDDAVPTLSINNVSQNEGNAGTTPFVFTVTLSAASGQPVTVNFATANGTATAGSDYIATSGTLTFASGVTSQTITVPVIGDTINEPDETFTVNLSAPSNATIATTSGLGTILNDDGIPGASINNVTQAEGNAGTTAFVFTVTLSATSGQTVTVNYATANGTATAGSDFLATSGTLTFAPGVTSQTINVPVIGDTVNEANETFSVILSGPTNAFIAVASGLGTILNDDGVPALSINSVSQAEGNSGTTPFVFTVTLSAPSGQPITVNYATANGTATAGSDYTATSGTLTFAPGVTSQSITVPVIGDTVTEPDETFTVNLSAPTNATITTASGLGTILNDDAACSAGPANLFPVNNAQQVPIDGVLQWAASAGATSYNVYLGFSNGCSTLFGTTTSTSLPYSNLAAQTIYQWRVEAISPSCPPASSACQTFTTGSGCPTQRPVIIAPANGSNLSSPVTFRWTPVSGAVGYQVFVSVNGGAGTLLGSTTGSTTLTASVPNGTINWFVQALFDNGCPPTVSTTMTFSACNTPEKPVITANGEATTGQPYFISWTPSTVGVSQFELLESPTPDFTGPLVKTFDLPGTTTTSPAFQHDVVTATPFYYRVLGRSPCTNLSILNPSLPVTPGDFSLVARVVIIPIPALNELNPDITTPVGSTKRIVQKLFVPGFPQQSWNFTTSTDEPWLFVDPPSGILPPQGVTLTVTADPSNLPNGTITGTVIITLTSQTSGSGKSAIANGTVPPPPINVPVSINVVTPITPISKTQPSPSTLIIPAVGHVSGAASKWQSDIRVTNAGVVPQKYQLTFTPSGTDATLSSKSTVITADGGATIALDDIVKRWYGLGSLNDGVNGVLEIRPVTVGNSIGGRPGTVADDISVSTVTLASSRTYNTTPNGTLGQFIPAIPFSSFIGAGTGNATSAILSIQQIAQSAAFRTNFGIVEGSGQPVSALASIFDNQAKKLASVPINLKAGEHQQLDNLLGKANITNLADGRIEVTVVSGAGKVMTYASVVDNKTNDPLLITGQTVRGTLARNFVVPGVADLNTGFASWRTDMRIFNSGAPVEATLTFYPQSSDGTPPAKHPPLPLAQRVVTINTNEVRSIDNLIQSEFGLTNVGGALHVTTVVDSPLIVSARTYNQTSNGTFGQFVPAVTTADAVGTGDRSLNILQVEDSDRFRTNLGLAEVTGQPATVEVSVIFSDTKVTPKIQFQLPANGFVQTRLLNMLGISHAQTYNARLVVRVTGGAGKVTAYGSVIDSKTEDPTYVPAQ